MSGRRWFRYLAAVSALAGLACGDYTGSTSPSAKKITPTSPVRGSYSRYILISGVWTCVEECDSSDPQPNAEGFPSKPDSLPTDSLPIQALPPDSLPIEALPLQSIPPDSTPPPVIAP